MEFNFLTLAASHKVKNWAKHLAKLQRDAETICGHTQKDWRFGKGRYTEYLGFFGLSYYRGYCIVCEAEGKLEDVKEEVRWARYNRKRPKRVREDDDN